MEEPGDRFGVARSRKRAGHFAGKRDVAVSRCEEQLLQEWLEREAFMRGEVVQQHDSRNTGELADGEKQRGEQAGPVGDKQHIGAFALEVAKQGEPCQRII